MDCMGSESGITVIPESLIGWFLLVQLEEWDCPLLKSKTLWVKQVCEGRLELGFGCIKLEMAITSHVSVRQLDM